MVKGNAVKATPVKAASKHGSIKQFLRELFIKDKNISNDKVLNIVLSKFSTSKATYKTVLTWKKELRDEGMDIPKQRAGAKPKVIAHVKAGKKK